MKNLLKSYKVNSIFLAVIMLMMVAACSKKLTFQNSKVVPAAEGSVKIKTDKNKNHSVDVKVTHLAPATKLSPSKNTYVVWMVTENNGTKNIGQLISSDSFLSNTLTGTLKTVTPFNPSSFFITAEDDGNVQYPGTVTVLSTQ